jgi:hypothetical protein
MIHRPSWRMREEGEMVACVAECPECHSPASVVVSSDLLRPPLSKLPQVPQTLQSAKGPDGHVPGRAAELLNPRHATLVG